MADAKIANGDEASAGRMELTQEQRERCEVNKRRAQERRRIHQAAVETAALARERAKHFGISKSNDLIAPPRQGIKEHPVGTGNALKGVVAVVSGVLDSFTREEFKQYVERHGGRTTKQVSGLTTHLVHDHGTLGSAKKKCLGPKGAIVSEDFIIQMVKATIPASAAAAPAPAGAGDGGQSKGARAGPTWTKAGGAPERGRCQWSQSKLPFAPATKPTAPSGAPGEANDAAATAGGGGGGRRRRERRSLGRNRRRGMADAAAPAGHDDPHCGPAQP